MALDLKRKIITTILTGIFAGLFFYTVYSLETTPKKIKEARKEGKLEGIAEGVVIGEEKGLAKGERKAAIKIFSVVKENVEIIDNVTYIKPTKVKTVYQGFLDQLGGAFPEYTFIDSLNQNTYNSKPE